MPETVTRYTRAPLKGRAIVCPHCSGSAVVYHFAWSALGCIHCERMIPKDQWLIDPTP